MEGVLWVFLGLPAGLLCDSPYRKPFFSNMGRPLAGVTFVLAGVTFVRGDDKTLTMFLPATCCNSLFQKFLIPFIYQKDSENERCRIL